MLDGAPDARYGRRNDVAPVRDRRGPEYDHQLRTEPEQLLDCELKRRLFMWHAALADDGRASGSEPLRGNSQSLVHHFRRQPRQQRRDNTDAFDDIRGDPQRAAACSSHRGIAQLRFHPERNELHGCNHFAFDHRLVGGQRCKRNRFVDGVDAVDLVAVHHQHARLAREQIGAACKGALDVDTLARDGSRDAGGGDILGDLALLKPHHDDFLDPGAVQRLDFGGTDRGALLQHQRTLAQGVNRDATNRVGRTGGAELHAAASFGKRN